VETSKEKRYSCAALVVPRLIPYRAEHLLAFSNRDTAAKEEVMMAVYKERWGPSYTAVMGDEILGCGGCVILWSGVGMLWMVLSESMARYKIWFHRVVSRALEDVIRSYKLHRVEVVIYADNKRNQKWIESLGFRREGGKAVAYTTDKRDVIRYERVKL